jgi:GAF domain-containing protein
MQGESFERFLADAVRDLNAQRDPPHTLQRLVDIAPDFFDSCDYVGVSVVQKGTITTPAASNERLRVVDEAQYSLGEGPCREAIRTEPSVAVGDLETDPRWPRWGQLMVRELGVRSSLSFRLFTGHDETWGALNVYSTVPHAFTHEDVVHGQTIAAMAAVVLARSIKDEQLAQGLETRAVIGQATGILMERFTLSAEVAFDVLRRVSSQQNMKLRDLAADVVRSRRLPGLDGERNHSEISLQ